MIILKMNKTKTYQTHLIVILLIFPTLVFPAVKTNWWPEQKLPTQLVRIKPTNLKERNLVQSLSGLAAKGVNAGTNNELIWTYVTSTASNYFLSKWLQRTGVTDRGELSLWTVVQEYKTKNIVQGYVLYKEGDYSVNFATLYAGLYNSILVEETLESTAIANGLTLKYDARSLNSASAYTSTWFNTIKNSLNNKLIVTISPDDYRQRDMAIAYGCMVYWGVDDFYKSVLTWMEPNSPVVGWNDGDEATHVETATKYGVFTTGATVVNLLVYSAGALGITHPRLKNVNPKLLDFNTGKDYHAYVMSDGDNMMIQTSGLPLAAEYWGNADINNVPMSWTNCPVNLSQMVPDAWNYFAESSNNVPGNIIEFGGGYQYPDLYAQSRGANATTVHREFAGSVNKKMKATGTKVFGFITRNSVSSDAAKAAYQIYADSIENLVGIVAIQYVPYNGGGGSIYWVTNRNGEHIPVFTAKYQMWTGLNYTNSGNPAVIANLINTAANQSATPTIDWTIVHAWSYFLKDANNTISDATSTDSGALRGVTPTMWSKSLLNSNIEVVSIEELLWRLRMKYYPAETQTVIANYVPDDVNTNPQNLEIDFSNLTASSTDMMTASGNNNWTAVSGYQWNSQYCFAQDVTTISYIGKAIRFGSSILANNGKSTTPTLNLATENQEEALLQLTLGCGSTKGGQLEVKIDNTVLATIDATKNGDSGSNGTTFGAKMYDFEYVIPTAYATGASTISLTHSRSAASEYIYMNRFKVFRRNKLTANNTETVDNLQIKFENNALKITGVNPKTLIQVYSVLGQLLISKMTSSDMDINLGEIRKNQLLIIKASDKKQNIFSKTILINKN